MGYKALKVFNRPMTQEAKLRLRRLALETHLVRDKLREERREEIKKYLAEDHGDD